MSFNRDTGRHSSLRMPRGRGVSQIKIPNNTCLCERPHCTVLCNACGFITEGRVRHSCPIHPQIVFLLDITQCPKCKSYDFMLTEVQKD